MSAHKTFTLDEFLGLFDRAGSMNRDYRFTIRISNPGGLTAHQTIDASGMYFGFDWENGQMVIEPSIPLTTLTPEQLVQLGESARKGQSWHAYEVDKKHRALVKELRARIAELEATGASHDLP
jgi:hypothetical protein